MAIKLFHPISEQKIEESTEGPLTENKYVTITGDVIVSGWTSFDGNKSQYSCDFNYEEFDSVIETFIEGYKEEVSKLKYWDVLVDSSKNGSIETVLQLKTDADPSFANIEIQDFYDYLSSDHYEEGDIMTTYYPGTYHHETGANLPDGGYWEEDSKDDYHLSVGVDLTIDDLELIWEDSLE